MPDLPSGTVTFLFTDIEGSTALWERDRSAMAAVERHLALLDAAIQTRGVHFKTAGDAGAGRLSHRTKCRFCGARCLVSAGAGGVAAILGTAPTNALVEWHTAI
jgi:class 3 adenylate cyclase